MPTGLLRVSLLAVLMCGLPGWPSVRGASPESVATDSDDREPVEALRPDTNLEFLKIGPNDTSDELWARALWISLPPYDAESEQVASLFIAAIERAKEKAPIYVSFGQTDSGPSHYKQMLEGLTAALQEEVANEIEKEVESGKLEETLKQADSPAAEKRLREMMGKAYSKAGKSPKFRQELEGLAKTMTEGTGAAERYYLAALAEDPNYLPAHYFLAAESEGMLHEEAVANFVRHDPDNALGYYLQADIAIEKNDLAGALRFVEQGNKAKTYRTYESPLPQKFSLRYPQREDLQTFGVAGEPITMDAFHTLVRLDEERWSWNDPVRTKVRGITYSFEEQAKKSREAGELDKALPWWLAVRGMGWKLLSTDTYGWPSMSIVITGASFEAFAYEQLRSLYEAQKDAKQIEALDKEHGRILDFRHDMTAAFTDGRVTGQTATVGIFRGQHDPFRKPLQIFNEGRRKARFITW
jgi:hypothetical protein